MCINIYEGWERVREDCADGLICTCTLGQRYYSDDYDQHSKAEQLTEATELSSSIPATPTNLVRVSSAEDTRHYHHTPISGVRRKKSLINPFDPSKSHEEANSHKCRWMHAFSRDNQGTAFQTHHVTKLEKVEEEETCPPFPASTGSTNSNPTSGSSSSHHSNSSVGKYSDGTVSQQNQCSSEASDYETATRVRKLNLSMRSSLAPLTRKPNSTSEKRLVENFAWVRRAGTDWSSLQEPASLPVTTDYFPDDTTLNSSYVEYPGNLTVNSYGNDPLPLNKQRLILLIT